MMASLLWHVALCCLIGATLLINRVAADHEPSCIVRNLVKAGIDSYKACRYEKRLLKGPLSVSRIGSSQADLLSLALGATLSETTAIQECMNEESEQCKAYSPCENGGHCQLSLSNTSYECHCPANVTGTYCEKPLPAAEAELTALQVQFSTFQVQFAALEQELEVEKNKTKLLPTGSGCSFQPLGYKYQSRYAINDDQTNGIIANMTFEKKQADTVLRLSYSVNIRTIGAGKASRWYFKIDGLECSAPSKVDIIMFQSDAGNTHVPANLVGICESAGVPLGQGNHTITVHIGDLSGVPLSVSYTGWRSTATMEVQELCRQE